LSSSFVRRQEKHIGVVMWSRRYNIGVMAKRKNPAVVAESAETPVERVSEVEKRKLKRLIHRFQSEPDAARSHQQWKEIEKMVFGVDYPD
jgi:hypothetical protein